MLFTSRWSEIVHGNIVNVPIKLLLLQLTHYQTIYRHSYNNYKIQMEERIQIGVNTKKMYIYNAAWSAIQYITKAINRL